MTDLIKLSHLDTQKLFGCSLQAARERAKVGIIPGVKIVQLKNRKGYFLEVKTGAGHWKKTYGGGFCKMKNAGNTQR